MSFDVVIGSAGLSFRGAVRLRCPNRLQSGFVVECVDDLVEPAHPVRLLMKLVEGLDLSAFYVSIAARAGVAGRDATDASLLVALWLYACTRGAGVGPSLRVECGVSLAVRRGWGEPSSVVGVPRRPRGRAGRAPMPSSGPGARSNSICSTAATIAAKTLSRPMPTGSSCSCPPSRRGCLTIEASNCDRNPETARGYWPGNGVWPAMRARKFTNNAPPPVRP